MYTDILVSRLLRLALVLRFVLVFLAKGNTSSFKCTHATTFTHGQPSHTDNLHTRTHTDNLHTRTHTDNLHTHTHTDNLHTHTHTHKQTQPARHSWKHKHICVDIRNALLARQTEEKEGITTQEFGPRSSGRSLSRLRQLLHETAELQSLTGDVRLS